MRRSDNSLTTSQVRSIFVLRDRNPGVRFLRPQLRSGDHRDADEPPQRGAARRLRERCRQRTFPRSTGWSGSRANPTAITGLSGGARGTETRRKLLESLNSGAGTSPAPSSRENWGGKAAKGSSNLISDRAGFLAGSSSKVRRPGEGGTGMHRNPLKSPNSGAGSMPVPTGPPQQQPRSRPFRTS